MMNVIEIKDFNAPELDIYARCTEAGLSEIKITQKRECSLQKVRR